MNDNAIICLKHEDFMDRLIDNGFHFEVKLTGALEGEHHYRLFIPTYKYREKTCNDVGFHYYGKEITMYYYNDFDSMEDIYELIREAIDVMKNYMNNEVAKKLKDIIVHHLHLEVD